MGAITLGLNQRTRIVKKYTDWCKSKRIDIMPSTFMGWHNVTRLSECRQGQRGLGKGKGGVGR